MDKRDKHEKQKKLDDQSNGRLNIVEVDNDEYKKLLDGIKEVKTVGIDWDEVAAEGEAIKQSRHGMILQTPPRTGKTAALQIMMIKEIIKDIDQQAEQDGTFTRDHGTDLFDRMSDVLGGFE